MKAWTADDDIELQRLYQTCAAAEISLLMGRTKSAIKNRIQILKIVKPAGAKNAGRFRPGLSPWNKGMAFDSGGRSHETRFEPGHRGGKAAELYKPIGSERISKDGYLQRKINDDMPLQARWRGVHILVWEEANGPLPKGHAIVFKNKDMTDRRLENLECISRAELMRRNNMHTNYPKEITLLIQLRGAVTRQINKRKQKGVEV